MHLPVKRSLFSQERKTYLNKNGDKKEFVADLSETNLENIDPVYIKGLLKDYNGGFGYPSFHSYDLFAEKVSIRYGIDINKAQIFMGNGSFNLIERVLHKFLDLDFLIGYGPQFNEIPSDFGLGGGKYLSSNFASEKMGLHVNLIQDTIKKCSSKTAIYIDNPNNPTGYFYPLKEIEEVLQLAQKDNIIVIIDEAFGDYLPDDCSAINLVSKYSNIIVVRSMSKFFGLSGLRIGYAVMSRGLGKYYSKIDVPFEPSVLSLHIGSKLIDDYNIINDIRIRLSDRKRKIAQSLYEKNIEIAPTNDETPLLFFRKPDDEFLSSIKLVNGDSFDNTFQASSKYARLRLPNAGEEIDQLIKAIDQLLQT